MRLRQTTAIWMTTSIRAAIRLSKALTIVYELTVPREAAGGSVEGKESVEIDAADALQCGCPAAYAADGALPAARAAAGGLLRANQAQYEWF